MDLQILLPPETRGNVAHPPFPGMTQIQTSDDRVAHVDPFPIGVGAEDEGSHLGFDAPPLQSETSSQCLKMTSLSILNKLQKILTKF